jgi:putative endonuclease
LSDKARHSLGDGGQRTTRLAFGRYAPECFALCCAARGTRGPFQHCNHLYHAGVEARFFVYILASRYKGTLYVGVTNDLVRRIGEHKSGLVPGFTRKYGVHRLVYVEECASILEARARERVLKRWRREWKFALIEKVNPDWRDLTAELVML